jgi:hypothetical protein
MIKEVFVFKCSTIPKRQAYTYQRDAKNLPDKSCAGDWEEMGKIYIDTSKSDNVGFFEDLQTKGFAIVDIEVSFSESSI